ncbi:AT hook-like protein [Cynara cardunculus var. scolymus]|uniref:AT-hook motif nuclear-localized protein n=1 Tax=Cynara cardunculus var. scolymus TaxID=59895 RepID=A0A103XR56_CYNCS|nr:AT hook-like protein [Cynara cardunculus var. scolymus]
MDGREGMPSFYLNRGVSGSGSHAGSGSQGGGLHVPPPGFKTQSNPNMSPHGHSNIRVSSITYQMEHNISPVFPHGINMGGGGGGGGGIGGGGGGGAMSINTTPRSGSDSVVKKKRGRPRKYGPDGSHMALGLTPASVAASPGSVTPTPKKNRGRPPGSGRKQRLANDVAAKVLSFAQQRPRALCILSGNGAISAVTLRQFTSTGGTVTYEVQLAVGLSHPAWSSFVHGSNNSKGKTKNDAASRDEESPGVETNETSPTTSQHPIAWPPDSRNELRNSHTEIDLTRG